MMHHLPFLKFQLMQEKQILFKCNFSIFEHSAEQDSNLLFDQQKVCDSPYPIYESNVYLATFFFVVILKLSPKKTYIIQILSYVYLDKRSKNLYPKCYGRQPARPPN